jgi:hypothetical protein
VKFYGHTNSTTLHVMSSMKIIAELDVVHDDVMMKICVLTLEDAVDMWCNEQ